MKVFNTVLFALLFAALVAACSSETPVPISAPQSSSDLAGNPSLFRATAASYWEANPSPGLAGDPELFRAKSVAYWKAFNVYDLETLKTYYEPGLWLEDGGELYRAVDLLKQLAIQVEMEEQVAPVKNDQGEWEMMLLMMEPTGTRNFRMAWVESDDEWLLSAVTELPK
ncbi:MAG: hypothetical protein HQ475_01980 [SAR202 cluster bacterium]|nr:hypothetical protein [SAR202 cluster bacterium]